MLAGLRHPVLLAQTMATVDLISRGRLVIGASVGGAFNEEQRQEWQNAGVVPAQRARRMEEVVQIVQGLGLGKPLTFSGRHFNLDGVSMEPVPVRPGGIPILLACHWRARQDKQMARAAKLGNGLISISDTPEEYSQLLQRVREMVNSLGRDVAQFETAFYLTVNMGSDIAKAEAESEKFLMGYYGANIWGWRWGPFGDPEKVKDRMAEYVEAGAQTVMVRFASFDLERQLDIFLDKVAPAFS
jgi:alkanesulfonate monooxygenase SsuD/methylene tetrahydromethanopterin reductase-like flavin-dependent oxidoreductase (luciferase family)